MNKKNNLIFEARKRLGLTQKQLADALYVASNYIYMLESGKKPISNSVREKLKKLEGERFSITATSSAVAINGGTATNHPAAVNDAPCPHCAAKDAEINRLNKIIDRLLEK